MENEVKYIGGRNVIYQSNYKANLNKISPALIRIAATDAMTIGKVCPKLDEKVKW